MCESRISLWLFGREIFTPPLLPKHTTGSCKSLGDVTASPAGSASQFGSLPCITKVCGSKWVMSSLFLVSACCERGHRAGSWPCCGAGARAHMPSSDAKGSLVCNMRNARPTLCLQGCLPSQALDLIWMQRDL